MKKIRDDPPVVPDTGEPGKLLGLRPVQAASLIPTGRFQVDDDVPHPAILSRTRTPESAGIPPAAAADDAAAAGTDPCARAADRCAAEIHRYARADDTAAAETDPYARAADPSAAQAHRSARAAAPSAVAARRHVAGAASSATRSAPRSSIRHRNLWGPVDLVHDARVVIREEEGVGPEAQDAGRAAVHGFPLQKAGDEIFR